MNKLLMTLMCFGCFASANATVETFDPNTGTGTIGPSGCVNFCVQVGSDGETYTVDKSGCVQR